ncbi:MAG: NUDIX domain-containing protein [Lentisphaeria bacterium]
MQEKTSGERREWFEIVDEDNRIIGMASREQVHGNPQLIHRTAHVVVFGTDNRILLQKRSPTKDIQPGKWDTAVGGHLVPGEDYATAARREAAEELGITPRELPFLYLFDLKIRNEIESENVRVYAIIHDGPFDPPTAEIDELRFWDKNEIAKQRGTGCFTPNLEVELDKLEQSGKL